MFDMREVVGLLHSPAHVSRQKRTRRLNIVKNWIQQKYFFFSVRLIRSHVKMARIVVFDRWNDSLNELKKY